MTPGQPPDRQEGHLENFDGIKGLLIGDFWTHFKVHCIGAPQGRGVWKGELPPR